MNSKLPNHCLSIVGPTATGKTRRALELAEDLLKVRRAAGVDLISVDSRQVYQGFEVLTGQTCRMDGSNKMILVFPNF